MTKKIIAIVSFVLFLASLVSCSSTQSGSNIEIPDNEIILISRYINYAWGYDNNGIFIDSDGGVYSFDFSQEINNYNQNETDEIFLNKLQTIRTYTKPFVTLNANILNELYSYSSEINPNAELNSKHEAYDAGENQLMVCDTDTHKLVLCREKGDYSGTLQDTYAKKLLSFYDDTVNQIIYNGKIESETINPENNRREIIYTDEYVNNKTYYFTSEDLNIENIHCGYTEYEGRYIITNAEQFDDFTQKTGIDISGYDWSGRFPSDYYVYFVEIINVSHMGYDLKKSGIMCKGGAFEFIESPESIMPEADMQYGEAMDGFCFVAEFPKYIALQYMDEQSGTYNGFDTLNWIEP